MSNDETSASPAATSNQGAVDRYVISHLQRGFPLDAHPYAVLAERLSTPEIPLDESAVWSSVERLRASGVIRRIGATFDPAHLGYVSTLVGVAVADPEHTEALAQRVDAWPEVTHDYLREEVPFEAPADGGATAMPPLAYTLWFTVIACNLERQRHILEQISQDPDCASLLDLPTTHLFKIRVDFDVSGQDHTDGANTYQPPTAPTKPVVLDENDKALIRVLQGDLGHGTTPYADLMCSTDMGQQSIAMRIAAWEDSGVIRRLGAVVRHRKMGVTCNVMTVWDIPDKDVELAGATVAAFPEVSHCYARPRRETWPVNLYTMVHATSLDEIRNTVARMRDALLNQGIQVPTPRLLPSTREFKKRSMRFFEETDYPRRGCSL